MIWEESGERAVCIPRNKAPKIKKSGLSQRLNDPLGKSMAHFLNTIVG
jgi:hypothetical protein